MIYERNKNPDAEQPVLYRIQVRGVLDGRCSEWFDGLTVVRENSEETVLTGPVTDQAALFGILKKIRDLGLILVSVNTD